MGAQADCVCRYKGRSGRGTAHLETDELVFRGEFRLEIPYKTVTSATGDAGTLSITFDGGKAIFEIGDKAARWAAKINDPPTLMKKLGVKPELAISVVRVDDEDFVAELEAATRDVSFEPFVGQRDIIFFGAETTRDLDRLESLKAKLKPDGALWVIRPKGVEEITESDVIERGRRLGLVDVKVARFSDTHTAEKFVIRKDKR